MTTKNGVPKTPTKTLTTVALGKPLTRQQREIFDVLDEVTEMVNATFGRPKEGPYVVLAIYSKHVAEDEHTTFHKAGIVAKCNSKAKATRICKQCNALGRANVECMVVSQQEYELMQNHASKTAPDASAGNAA
jgi:hypothetical protein